MNLIILTASQAKAVRGNTSPGSSLQPVPLPDGTYALPADVLKDAAHKSRWADLTSLPQRASTAKDFPKR